MQRETRRITRTAVCLVLLAAAVGQAPCHAVVSAPASAEAPNTAYTLTAGDQVDISVLGHDDLRTSAVILPDGTITLPIAGVVTASGLTPGQLSSIIARRMSTQLNQPEVSVLVRERSAGTVSILGAVKQPGSHALKDGWRVLDLVGDSGGLIDTNPQAVSATLVRGSQVIPVDVAALMTTPDPDRNVPLKPNDLLLIQERDPRFVSVEVLGEVAKPGYMPAPSDGSIATVLAAAGGTNPDAALSQATILRNGATIPVDLRNAGETGSASSGVHLQAGDTLSVPKNRRLYAVFGEVRSPGYRIYPDDRDLSVLKAISEAGAQTGDADLKKIVLLRPVPDGKGGTDGKYTTTSTNLDVAFKQGDLSHDLPVQPGDLVYVPSRKRGSGIQSFLQYLSPLSAIAALSSHL